MAYGEGRRDAAVPLYRLKPVPPKGYFMDFACACEVFGLNYMPRYFRNTEFFHDIFHGFKHLCSIRFDSRRSAEYSALNTSIMEQVKTQAQRQERATRACHSLAVVVHPTDQLVSSATPRITQVLFGQGGVSLFFKQTHLSAIVWHPLAQDGSYSSL